MKLLTIMNNKKSRNRTILLIAFGLLYVLPASAQWEGYGYQRPIENVTAMWQKIELPPPIYSRVNPQISDLRIMGITAEKDTIEVPYLLRTNEQRKDIRQVPFELINTTRDQNASYFTFKMSEETSINRIKLTFKNKNFDWNIALQGSQDQKKWFDILNDYRIISLDNQNVQYDYTTLDFPKAQYPYFRLTIPAAETIELLSATIFQEEIIAGKSKTIEPQSIHTEHNKATKTSILTIDLPEVVPVNTIQLPVKDALSYYRSIEIETLTDSIHTEKGWRYSYHTLYQGTLSSMEKNKFQFLPAFTKKLRIVVRNQDNQPLNFGQPVIEFPVHSVTARFNKTGNFYLLYGKENASTPRYDLAQFADEIPQTLPVATLGEEIKLATDEPGVEPLFENKWWLWGIMLLIIVVLGGFTLKMMKGEQLK